MKPKKVGCLTRQVAELLQLDISSDVGIFIGESNIRHMISKHRVAYEKYGLYIEEILQYPDYVGLNTKDESIEYVKEFRIENEYVKVAVRVSGSGAFYARSLYVLNNNRVRNFIEKGALKPLTNQAKHDKM